MIGSMFVKMAKFTYPAVAVLAFILFWPGLSIANKPQEKVEIIAAVLTDFPPLYELDANGQPAGFAIDILEKVAADTDIRVRYLLVENWAKAMQAIRSGTADIIPGIGISPARLREFSFSDKMETIPVSCFVRQKNFTITGIDDLAGHKVAVLGQSAAATKLAPRQGISLVPYPNIDSALMDLLAGEVDAFVFPEPVLLLKARQAGVCDNIKVVGEPLMELKRGFLVRKSDTALLDKLNPVIKDLVHSEAYLKYYIHWYGREVPFWTGDKIFIVLSVFLLIVLFAMLVWRNISVSRSNRKLQDSISARQKVEAALRASEELYRSLIDNIDLGITYIDNDHNIILTNPAQGRLFAKPVHGFIGKKCFVEFERRDEICSHCPGVIAMGTGKVQEAVTEGIMEDGSKFTVLIKAFPVLDANGGKNGFIEVVEDITEKIKTEKAMLDSEALLQSVFRAAPVGIGLVVDRVMSWTNRRFSEIIGYSAEELRGQSSRILYPSDEEFAWVGQEKYIQIKEHGTGSVETKFRRKDGKIIDVLLSSTPLDVDDLSKGVTFSALDITGRKKAEFQLADEKERLAVTLRSIGDGVITTDVAGNVVFLNKVAEKLCGWRQTDALGRPLSAVFHIINEKTRVNCENPAEKVLESGVIIGLANHTALISKDGVERSIADSGAPIRDSNSNIVGVVLVFRDVTAQNRMEEEILKVKKLESVGVLAGGIAHDFNNILSAILGNVNMAMLNEDPENENYELLAEAEKASLRARDLTKQLLTFSKGGAPVKETSSLADVIKDSANFVLHGEKVSCKYEIPEDLWLAEVDKGQISQVIQNLIINAVHAMPEGGVISIVCENVDSAKQTIPLSFSGSYVKISITDTGIGIPSRMRDKIFDPYFSTKQEGSGLGLAITHAIITKHDGYIFVDSTPGIGSKFTIYLPASQGEIPEVKTLVVDSVKVKASKILVMDDEELVLKLTDKMLTRLGHEVVLARTGEEALALYGEHFKAGQPFDLVIMDLTIPGGMGGEQAVKAVLEIEPGAKVVVSSGYSTDPIMANFQEYGFAAAMAKPFQMQELNSILARVLV